MFGQTSKRGWPALGDVSARVTCLQTEHCSPVGQALDQSESCETIDAEVKYNIDSRHRNLPAPEAATTEPLPHEVK